jgi:hypothetical protein
MLHDSNAIFRGAKFLPDFAGFSVEPRETFRISLTNLSSKHACGASVPRDSV